MAKKRGGLGRGLESLFEDVSPSFESDNKVETLPLREIEPDPDQPRKNFDEDAMAALAESIGENGRGARADPAHRGAAQGCGRLSHRGG